MLCRIGDVEIWRILEINAPFLSAEELFPDAGPDLTKEITKHAPKGQFTTNSKLVILPVQGFLLRTPDHLVLVDACVGNDKTNKGLEAWHKRSDTRFMAALQAAGAAPEDVDYVMCTHLHADHIGWNTQLVDGRWVPTFPNARYLLPEADTAFYAEKAGDGYKESVLPLIEAGQAELVGPDHKLGDLISLIDTPGHSPGHVSVHIKSDGAEAIITGDAIHLSAQCWHPEWGFKFDSDAELARGSRRKLLETAVETNARVIGTHFYLPSIGRVRAHGDAFKWEEDA